MSIRDGRKRAVVYFGDVSPERLLDWYYEIKESLKNDGFPITHFGLSMKTKVQKRITQIKRTEKRYIELFNSNPSEASCIELYHIEDDAEYLSACYLINMMLNHSFITNKSYAMMVFDFSILDKIKIEKYMDITKKYVKWGKEIVFDCGNGEAPINYVINMRPWGFKEFKLICEKTK